jgi:hypothetical protein
MNPLIVSVGIILFFPELLIASIGLVKQLAKQTTTVHKVIDRTEYFPSTPEDWFLKHIDSIKNRSPVFSDEGLTVEPGSAKNHHSAKKH